MSNFFDPKKLFFYATLEPPFRYSCRQEIIILSGSLYMAIARCKIVNPKEVGCYHCISRCVRRAYLCGEDRVTGRSFSHRRDWIRARLAQLARVFTIEVISYAIMSNHLHSLVRIRPDLAALWTPEEVARRWRTLFPRRRVQGRAEEPSEEEIQAIVLQPALVEKYRTRLASLSWFHRCLNEKIARWANAEDDCTGRFWEGRYKCQRVEEPGGVLSCAVYIDLNPIRAGKAKTPEESDHTSVQDRIHEIQGNRPSHCRNWAIVPLVSIAEITNGTVGLPEYLKLVDETGRLMRENKANISKEFAPILERLGIKCDAWMDTTRHLSRKFRRVVGSERFIEAQAKEDSKLWLHGMRSARAAFIPISI